MSNLTPTQRFKQGHSCPICQGYDEMPRGQGHRCHGFLSGDGKYAHCSREEHAGSLPPEPKSQTYAHRLIGNCRCGVQHDPSLPPASRNGQVARRIAATYDYTDASGTLLYQTVRYAPKAFKQRRPNGNGGWIHNLKGVRRIPYRLPQLLEAIALGKVVCIAEGEADVEALEQHGYTATCNSEGAGKWTDAHSEHLRDAADVVLFGDNDEPGRRHVQQVVASLQRVGVTPRVTKMDGLPEHGDLQDWLKTHTQEDLDRLIAEAPVAPEEHAPPEGEKAKSPWQRIKSVREFLAEPERPFEGLAKDLLAPGAITILSAPKGLGKTQVALALAVALATGGIFRGERVKSVRVLLLDRDNPEPVLKQRLRNWGAIEAESDHFHLLTRQDAPDLKDRDAWADFPLDEYDVLIIDAVGSFTEGITEKEGRLTTEVLATLLDLARRGIAILLLMNVTKDGQTFRGRGEWTERVDIAYEVRDATGFTPSAKREWWRELPAAGEAEWADRAARRKGKVTFRLAFVPNKFRLGVEPDPFCLELHLPANAPWTLADVTDQLIVAGESAAKATAEAKQAQQDEAVQALADLVAERHSQGNPLIKKDAEEFLREHNIGRNEARNLIEMYVGVKWHVSDEGKGVSHTLLPLVDGEVARLGEPATDKASQPSEPRQPVPQGGEVMTSETPPQERPPETSPPRRQSSDHTCATHGEGGMVPENGRWICGICLGMPLERIELLRQRGRLGGGTTEA
jgi:5S rRNA maturation endonuclease (ribonuclease M5)